MSDESAGLLKTLKVLAQTDNESALEVLIAALDSPLRAVQEGAVRALVSRHSIAGHRELLRRWDSMCPRWKTIIGERPSRIEGAVRQAITGHNESFCISACNAALWYREYDLVPVLALAAMDESHPQADLAAQTLLSLCELLQGELAAARDYKNRRDPQMVRRHVVATLGKWVEKYEDHKRSEIVESFLLLCGRNNPKLIAILFDPLSHGYRPVAEILVNSDRPGIARLLVSYLKESNSPAAAVKLIGHRTDKPFILQTLRAAQRTFSPEVRANIRKLETIDWIGRSRAYIREMGEDEQYAAMHLVGCSSIPRADKFGFLQFMLSQGNASGRLAATEVLGDYNEPESAGLVRAALADNDPLVQAAAVRQLRRRSLPGAMTKLIECVDSPHKEVRTAARDSLQEFTFRRYLAAFDMLEDDVRVSTGMLVKKVDPSATKSLINEFRSDGRSRRLRGLAVAEALKMITETERGIIRMLADTEYIVRAEAARLLGESNTETSRIALRDAMLDSSAPVKDAAERSLAQLAEKSATVGPGV